MFSASSMMARETDRNLLPEQQVEARGMQKQRPTEKGVREGDEVEVAFQ